MFLSFITNNNNKQTLIFKKLTISEEYTHRTDGPTSNSREILSDPYLQDLYLKLEPE